jgi:hypothetical protein
MRCRVSGKRAIQKSFSTPSSTVISVKCFTQYVPYQPGTINRTG